MLVSPQIWFHKKTTEAAFGKIVPKLVASLLSMVNSKADEGLALGLG